MSKKVRDALKKKLLEPEFTKRSNVVIGVVTDTYYEVTEIEGEKVDDVYRRNQNMVDISCPHPVTGKNEKFLNVPLLQSNQMGGVQGRRIQKKDQVMVLFVNNDMNFPRVIGRYFNNKKQQSVETTVTHGTNVPDYFDAIL